MTSVSGPNYVTVDRNLAMELVRVTEAAALAGGAWLGKVCRRSASRPTTLFRRMRSCSRMLLI